MLIQNLREAILYCSALFFMCLSSCYKETPIYVTSNFSTESEGGDYAAPVTINIENVSSGADRYRWTFEGGNPSYSDKKQPEKIVYRIAGTYKIRLEAWNDNHRDTKEMELVLDAPATLDFDPRIQINAFVPVEVRIENRTQNATAYEWLFEGGSPETSTEHQPPAISYAYPGEYTITMKVTAGRKTHELTKKIILLPELKPDFTLTPLAECEDMQAPWKARVQNNTISGAIYFWNVPGGQIANDTASQVTEVTYDRPGTYTLALEAQNGKQTKTKSQTITILENTNLQVMENVRLGINTSSEASCFYSCRLRRVISKEEVYDSLGKEVDFVFFGLNSRFSYCLFLSPDAIQDYVFDPIPGAGKTAIVNILEDTNISFSASDFDAMKDDRLLRPLSIKNHETEDRYFHSGQVPRLVFFETADGRKGVIKIKKFIEKASDSSIEVDIKTQKEKPNQ